MSGERPRPANARHTCFVMDASVSVKTAGTAELDEEEPSESDQRSRSVLARSESASGILRRDAASCVVGARGPGAVTLPASVRARE